jgi:dienelactone hydrolase
MIAEPPDIKARCMTGTARLLAALLLLLAPAAAMAQGAAAPVAPADKPKPPPRLEATDLTDLKKIATACFKAKNGERADLLAQVAKIDAEHTITKADIDAFARTLAVLVKQGFRLDGKAGKGAHPDYPAADFIMQAHGAAGGPKLPLFVSLHGKGGNPSGAPAISMKGPHVVIAPGLIDQGENWNTEREEQWVLELIETAKRTWDIDTNRIYMTGFSMGGFGTWSIGCFHADRFAALAPGGGGLFPEPILVNLKNTPTWISHGAKDTTVSPDRDRTCDKQLAELKEKYGPYDYTYKEHPNAGHEYPDCPQACQWMATKIRNPYPKHIVWFASPARQNRLYWLRADAAKGGGRIEAKVEKENRITIEGAPAGLEILLHEKMGIALGKEIVVEKGGKEAFRGVAAYSLEVLLESFAAGRDPEMYFYARIRLP